MAVITFHHIVVQVHKRISDRDNSVIYHAKTFPDQGKMTEHAFEYRDGNFGLIHGEATEQEKDLLIHSIQVLELANAFL